MTLTYGNSFTLEQKVLAAWDTYERGYLHGAIAAERFQGNPRSAVDLLLAPYALNHPEVNQDGHIRSIVSQIADLCSVADAAPEDEAQFMNLFITLADYLKNQF